MWTVPSAVTPPKSRTPHRFLLPAASVMDHGAQQVESAVCPTVYPYRHIYVDEGAKVSHQDGTPSAPFTSLEEVLKDEALQKVCQTLSRDYIHIHLRQRSTATLGENGVSCVFNGQGVDFCGRLIIEPWPGNNMTTISASFKVVIKLPSLSGKGSVSDFKKAVEDGTLSDFYDSRHEIEKDQFPSSATVAVFRNFRGVFFFRMRPRLSCSYGCEGRDEDMFGNNSPYDLGIPAFDACGFQACHGCGFYQCQPALTGSANLDFPDPLDVYYELLPDHEEQEEKRGHLSAPPIPGGPSSSPYGFFTRPSGPPREDDDIPTYDDGSFMVGKFYLVGTLRLMGFCKCNDFRMAECSTTIINDTNGVGGMGAVAVGRYSCSRGYSRSDSVTLSVTAVAREYVYTYREYASDGMYSDLRMSLSGGAYAMAAGLGDAEVESSTIIKPSASSTAYAVAQKSSKVDTEVPYFRSLAIAAGILGGSKNKVSTSRYSQSASVSSSWGKDFCLEIAKDTISREELRDLRIYM